MERMQRAQWLKGDEVWESPNRMYRLKVENVDWLSRKVYFMFSRFEKYGGRITKVIEEKRFSVDNLYFGASVSNNDCLMACGMSGYYTHYVWYMDRSLKPEPITVMEAVPIYGVYIH